jgi:hypothetical protein
MKIDYDRQADVLYITLLRGKRSCRYVENGHGAILRIDRVTSELVGCTIPMFSRRVSHGGLDIPEIGDALSTEALAELIPAAR